MRRLLALAVFLLALPMSAKDPPAKTGLPAAAARPKREFDAALLAADKTRDAAIKKAAEKFAAELKPLRAEATKAGKLDDALALRDAEQAAIKAYLPLETMTFVKTNGDSQQLTIDARGYRWSDWKEDSWSFCEMNGTGGILCYSTQDKSKFWAHLVIALDGKSAVFWIPDNSVHTLKAK